MARTNVASSRSDVAWTTDQPNWNRVNAQRNLFPPQMWKDIGAATDGTSNTIAGGEIVTTPGEGSLLAKGTVVIRDATPRPQICLDVRDPAKSGQVKETETIHSEYNRGHYFSSPLLQFSGFCTILPPNSPNCTGGAGWNDGTFSASSYHTGGVNVSFLDGSVQFISETIGTGDLTFPTPGYCLQVEPKKMPTDSQYGVWGALGTPAGGESKGLP